MRRIRHLMRKELLELRQDPRLFGVVILAPILQLTVLGYAAISAIASIHSGASLRQGMIAVTVAPRSA